MAETTFSKLWELIDNKVNHQVLRAKVTTERMKVPGGWIVRTIAGNNGGAISTSVSQVFFEDAGHYWDLKKSQI